MQTILGVDEAGRGPLAGPVAVGVVAIAEGFDLVAAFPGLNDSKKLSEKNRERIFALLEKTAEVRYAVEFADARVIDAEGISKAIRDALSRGVRALVPDPSDVSVFLDGSLKAPAEYAQETVIGGDGTIPAIMLASVAAKVARDRLMRELAKKYPSYGFEKHKGYGTAAHYAALRTHGPCEIHRHTFLHLDRASGTRYG
ncbi:MAG: ribonuclease HII [bacterium]